MRKHPVLVAGAALLAALALTWGFSPKLRAQVSNIAPSALSGNEAWSAAALGPGSQSEWVTVNHVRGTVGYQLFTSAGAGGTVTFGPNVQYALVNVNPANNTVYNPPTPSAANGPLVDGQTFAVCNTSTGAFAVNTFTLAAASGFSISGGTITLTTLAAQACARLVYNASGTTWYRVQ